MDTRFNLFHTHLKYLKAKKEVIACTCVTNSRAASASSVALMKVYPNELEAQGEFDGFTEWLQTFELYRGKHSDVEFEDDGRAVGKFKVGLF